MGLPALATSDALASRLADGIPEGAERRAQALLEDASTLVRSTAGLTWVDAEGELIADIPDLARLVVLAAAKRAFENPKGVRSETAGPFTVQHANRDGDLVWLTDAEVAQLGALRTKPRLWTQSTTRCEVETGALYADVDPAGSKLPWLARDQF